MDKLKNYTLCLLALSSIICGQSAASEIEEKEARTISVFFDNKVSGVELSKPHQRVNNLEVMKDEATQSSPFILASGAEQFGQNQLAYDIEVVLTLLGKEGYSKVISSALPEAGKPVQWDFKVPGEVVLDRILLSVTAKGAKILSFENGTATSYGSHEFISLSTCWHQLDYEGGGWLIDGNRLYAYFMQNRPFENSYKVVFGNKYTLFSDK